MTESATAYAHLPINDHAFRLFLRNFYWETKVIKVIYAIKYNAPMSHEIDVCLQKDDK